MAIRLNGSSPARRSISNPVSVLPASVQESVRFAGAPAVTLESGRFDWYGRDPNWKDVKGFRGDQDVEKPVGEWNTLECVCDGGKITNILNGKVVNAAIKCSQTRGKILFRSEGAEVFFRKIDLVPLRH